MNIKRTFLSAFALVATLMATAQEARLMRFPHIQGDQVVFSYAGDIYTVNAGGGTARRLTADVGYEMFPRISPDGKYIAFTGQYDGNTEVYLMPSQGGDPIRLTYSATLSRDDVGDRSGPNNIVIGWTPDSKNILFRSRNRSFNSFRGQLYTVSVDGGLPVEVPLHNGGFGSFSPDGKKLAYNYIFREFRTWKRYEGGMSDNIRIFDFDTKQNEQITDYARQAVFPMWAPDGKTIYYITDQEGVMNLYRYDLDSKASRKVTDHSEYDIKFPSIGSRAIVYENGGYLYRFDLETQKTQKIPVRIDNDGYARTEWKDVSKQVSTIGIAPTGERILLAARGDIFSVPVKEGVTYNLTNSSTANDNRPTWSPDGKSIAYVSDKDGEFAIYIRNMASGHEKRLTDKKLQTYIFGLKWSPDSKKLAWHEKLNTLNITDVESGRNTVVETSGLGLLGSYNWSPDSQYLVYIRPEKQMNNIIVYEVEGKNKHLITDGWYSVSAPNFSSDGKYLVFASARTFTPTYSNTEWNHVYTNMNKVYLIPLAEGAKNPFAPGNDTVADTETKTEDKKDDKTPVHYDFAALNNRIVELPIAASNYGDIHMVGDKVYYFRGGTTWMYDLKNKEEKNIGVRISMTWPYKKALAIAQNQFEVVNVPTAPVKVEKPVSLANVKRFVNYRQEWQQIYDETWRQMRDFFYAKHMHGVDWNKVYDRYNALIPHVNHRSDLTYVIGEMIGELNVGHAYSQNGEHPKPSRIPLGLLGAQFHKDASGYFRVKKIIQGANWSAAHRSPLTAPEVNVKEGDYIISINGIATNTTNNLFSLLIDQAGKTVEMEVNSNATDKGARKVLVTPIADEGPLYYYDWVQTNIRKVSEATDGQVGYIHIPDMGVPGLNEFVKHYYPQLGKKALIIDDRGNGGGNVSPMIIERLLRTPAYYTMHTNQTEGAVNPVGTFLGPKVLLVNEYSASDGDLFPYRFKHYNLGTVIGRRTWGGVVGYSGTIPVVDGGSIVTPSYAPYDVDGKQFIIEGWGVEPDIDLFNDPYRDFNGDDQQLSKAIEVALEKLKTESKSIPAIPPFPDKSK